MNYHPNPFAMSLRKNTPRTIGVIVPDIVTHFFASILSGIEDTAIANGYFVIITTSHESYDHEKRNIENLVNMHVEGIIGCLSQETTDYAHWLSLDDMNMPLVLFDRVCMPDRFSTVVLMEYILLRWRHSTCWIMEANGLLLSVVQTIWI